MFHWPRVDLDTLLCVRLADVPSCYWSGGFFIDRTDAFHIALRLATSQTSKKLFNKLSSISLYFKYEYSMPQLGPISNSSGSAGLLYARFKHLRSSNFFLCYFCP